MRALHAHVPHRKGLALDDDTSPALGGRSGRARDREPRSGPVPRGSERRAPAPVRGLVGDPEERVTLVSRSLCPSVRPDAHRPAGEAPAEHVPAQAKPARIARGGDRRPRGVAVGDAAERVGPLEPVGVVHVDAWRHGRVARRAVRLLLPKRGDRVREARGSSDVAQQEPPDGECRQAGRRDHGHGTRDEPPP